MASQFRSARHVAARNTILVWLAGVIVFAGVGILLTYHALRDSSVYATRMTPLMSAPDATRPAPTLKSVRVGRPTDASADIARAHSSAVASATGEKGAPAAPQVAEPAAPATTTTTP